MSEVKIQRELFNQVVDEIKPLLEKHWKEVANYRDDIKLEPDWQRYEALENNGALLILTARRDDVLVGYSVFIISNHLHYTSCKVGANDILFLLPEERKGRVGMKLIMESEKVLKQVGVNRVIWHVKKEPDFSPLLKHLGYEHEEIVMGKLLK